MNQKANELKADYDKYRKECERLRKMISAKATGKETNGLLSKTVTGGSQDAFEKIPKTNFICRRQLRGHFGKIYAMDWADFGDNLVSASQDGKLLIWDGLTSNKILAIPLRSSWVMTCAYSPTGKLVACGGLDNMCSIYDTDQHNTGWDNIHPRKELLQHEGYLSCCKFINDSEIITSSGDGTCILWDIDCKAVKATFNQHKADVMSVSIFDDRNVFVSGSCDSTAKIFDYRANMPCVGTFIGHDSDINDVQWFPDGYAFATGSDDSTIRLFDQRAYRELNIYKKDEAICGITSLCFSKTGKYLFSGYDDKPYCYVWDTLGAAVVQNMGESGPLGHRVSCVGMQSEGHALCTGSWDNMLRIWA